jgi:hypothetical protein
MHRVAPQRLARVRATRSARLVVWSSGARALASRCGATRRAEPVDTRRGVLARSWTDVHSLAPPCGARPQAQRGVCGDIKQALRTPHSRSALTYRRHRRRRSRQKSAPIMMFLDLAANVQLHIDLRIPISTLREFSAHIAQASAPERRSPAYAGLRERLARKRLDYSTFSSVRRFVSLRQPGTA